MYIEEVYSTNNTSIEFYIIAKFKLHQLFKTI